LVLFTEASIDLAEDAELMDLMTEANFIAVFVGIESPNEESLRETKKYQNLRKGGTLVDKVHRIQSAGMEVWCGMIMGFDSDDTSIFDRQIEFIQRARIPFSMSGMLFAIPKTPLYDRLLAEGRLDLSEPPEYGTNVIPLLMSSEELRDGYIRVLDELYAPDAYFARAEELFLDPNFEVGSYRSPYWKQHPWKWFKKESRQFARAVGFCLRLMSGVTDPALRREYRKRLWRFLKVHRRPGLVVFYLFHLAMHYHAYTLSQGLKQGMREGRPQLVNSF
jgi:radical SAM superfamily enzyme YgiQ (UPF0313 family)